MFLNAIITLLFLLIMLAGLAAVISFIFGAIALMLNLTENDEEEYGRDNRQ